MPDHSLNSSWAGNGSGKFAGGKLPFIENCGEDYGGNADRCWPKPENDAGMAEDVAESSDREGCPGCNVAADELRQMRVPPEHLLFGFSEEKVHVGDGSTHPDASKYNGDHLHMLNRCWAEPAYRHESSRGEKSYARRCPVHRSC